MSEFKNKRLHFSAFDCFFVSVFLLVLMFSTYLWSQYMETKDLYNIEKTTVDFIIPAPSKEQVKEIEDHSSIDKVVPYVYKTTTIKSDRKDVNANLYIIEDRSDLKYTVFSDDLLIKQGKDNGNISFISSEMAKKAKLSIDDSFTCSIRGNSVELTVAGIYKDDHRNVDGTIIAIMQDDVKSACGNEYKYNGAYISSNNIESTREYLKTYEPKGDLRLREEFDSDEMYQAYIVEHQQTDYTKNMFDKSAFVKDLKNRNDSKLIKQLLYSFSAISVSILLMAIGLVAKTHNYMKHGVKKDIKNNFSYKQEKKMFASYFGTSFVVYILAMIISAVIGLIVFSNSIFGLNWIIGFISFVVMIIIVRIITVSRLKNKFYKRA